jgi:hypothetical protein
MAMRNRTSGDRPEHGDAQPVGDDRADGFVPPGVDEAAWRHFEDRVRERRHGALIRTADAALASGDIEAAQRAIAEGRAMAVGGGPGRPPVAPEEADPGNPAPVDPQWLLPAVMVLGALMTAGVLVATFL